MQKLFVDFVPDEQVVLDREQSRHIIKSLRMKKGRYALSFLRGRL